MSAWGQEFVPPAAGTPVRGESLLATGLGAGSSWLAREAQLRGRSAEQLRQLGEVRRHPAPLYKARGSPATDRLAA